MRTTPPRHGARRLLLSSALAVPLSVLMLGAPAAAAAPADRGPAPAAQENAAPHSAAAPAQDNASPSTGEPASSSSSSSGSSSASSGSPSSSSGSSSSSSASSEDKPGTRTGQSESSAPAQRSEPKPEKTAPAAAPAKKSEPAAQPAPKRTEHPGTSGTSASPQPLSGADKNGTGANPGDSCGHDYCSTRNGDPSKNGQGAGDAKGKPCAGCVGKADNKNPKGQFKNGSDANNGYECDGNKGIAKTNPAHTGCKKVTTQEPPCVPTAANNMCKGPCVPTAANNMCKEPCVPTAANNMCTPPCVPTVDNNMCGSGGCVPSAANNFCLSGGCVPSVDNNFCGSGGCVDTADVRCTPSGPPVCLPVGVAGPQNPLCEPPSVLPFTPERPDGSSVVVKRPAPDAGVLPATLVRVPAVSPRAVIAPLAAAVPTALPFTGGEALLMGQVAAALLVVGAVAVRAGRRRAATR